MTEITIHASESHSRALGDLKAYDRNVRTHPEAQIGTLMEIIRDSGFTNPLLIEEDGTSKLAWRVGRRTCRYGG